MVGEKVSVFYNNYAYEVALGLEKLHEYKD